MTQPRNNAEQLKHQHDLRAIVAHFWGEPQRRTRTYDVHFARWRDDGHKPAFTVYATYYKDYGGTGSGGDIYNFLQAELNCDFKTALDWLENYSGQTPATPPQPHQQRTNLPPQYGQAPGADWQQAASQALATTQVYLWSNRHDARAALAYLRDVRGLTDESIQAAGYGYNPQWLPVDWSNPNTAKAAYLAPGIIEPWHYDGHLWALRVRCRVGNLAQALNIPDDVNRTGNTLPKYLNLAGSVQTGAIYGGDAITAEKTVVLVEGGFDAVLANQVLTPQYVAVTLGAATNRPLDDQIAALRRAKRVILLLDSDAAGQSAQKYLQEKVGDTAIAAQIPDGKDITEYLLMHDGDLCALLDAINSPAWWPTGLPDNIRSALLTYFRDSTAPVMELLNTALHKSLLNPEYFTIEDITHANALLRFNLAEASIRRVLNDLEGYFFAKLEANSPKHLAPKNENNRGRRPAHYAVLSRERIKKVIAAFAAPRLLETHHSVLDCDGEIVDGIVANPTTAMLMALDFDQEDAAEVADQLAEALRRVFRIQGDAAERAAYRARRDLERLRRELENPVSTLLSPEWDISSAAKYRAAYLRATNDPHQRRSRKQIARLLGISDSRVDAMIKRAGLQRAQKEGEYEIVPLENSRAFVQQVRKAARDVKGYPKTLIIERPDESQAVEVPFRGAQSQQVAQVQLMQGAAVSVRYQVANHYVEATSSIPDPALVDPPKTRRYSKAPRRSTYKPPRAKPAPFFGTGHDPAWVTAQLKLALLLLKRAVYVGRYDPAFVDALTGEVLDHHSGRDLLRLLLPDCRKIDPEDS